MLHARQDYNERIQDVFGIIPQDEPVFFMRATDPGTLPAMETWRKEAVMAGVEPHMLETVDAQMERIRAWQARHGTKVPDMRVEDVVRSDLPASD